MNISQFSIKRPVVTTMIIVSMVIFGIMTLINLKTQLLPNYNIPTVTVRSSWKGASPEDMEKLVTQEIEDGLTKVEGIKRVTTDSSMGKSSVTVEFEFGTDVDSKVNDITTAISRIRNNLPEDMDEPWVSKAGAFADRVMMFSITGENQVELKSFADNLLIPRLERIEGVGEISVFGGFEREVLISLDPNKLEAYNLNISELYSILKKSSLNFPAGYIREGDKEYLVRVYGEAKTLEDIKEIVIKNDENNPVYLTDVADVSLSVKDLESYGRTNGSENIIVSVEKTDNGNAIVISDTVKNELDKIESMLPRGAKFNINRDSSIDIQNSIDSVTKSA
ncbi:MAG: efflux RND transporter permease subunit, partial [Cetobacterium sp.]